MIVFSFSSSSCSLQTWISLVFAGLRARGVIRPAGLIPPDEGHIQWPVPDPSRNRSSDVNSLSINRGNGSSVREPVTDDQKRMIRFEKHGLINNQNSWQFLLILCHFLLPFSPHIILLSVSMHYLACAITGVALLLCRSHGPLTRRGAIAAGACPERLQL